MRFGISFKILPGVRVGLTRATGRRARTRLWASERLGPIRLTESTGTRRRNRRR